MVKVFAQLLVHVLDVDLVDGQVTALDRLPESAAQLTDLWLAVLGRHVAHAHLCLAMLCRHLTVGIAGLGPIGMLVMVIVIGVSVLIQAIAVVVITSTIVIVPLDRVRKHHVARHHLLGLHEFLKLLLSAGQKT